MNIFDPTILDGKSTVGLEIEKSNWAQKLIKGHLKLFQLLEELHLHMED